MYHLLKWNKFIKRYALDDSIVIDIPVEINNRQYSAVMLMWDNTARRNHRGIIFQPSTPELYKEWLIDIVKLTESREDLDD